MKRTFIPSLLTSLLVLSVTSFLLIKATDFISKKPAIRAYCQKTTQFMSTNQFGLQQVLTDVFDQAQACALSSTPNKQACRSKISSAIVANLHNTDSLPDFPSTYFVRPGVGNTIQKLFLNGEYKETPLVAKSEKIAMRSISRRKALCDQGFKLDAEFTYMTYFKDVYAEAETIFPVTNASGTVLGAVVRNWAD